MTKECYAAYLATCEKMTLMLQQTFVEELLTLKIRGSAWVGRLPTLSQNSASQPSVYVLCLKLFSKNIACIIGCTSCLGSSQRTKYSMFEWISQMLRPESFTFHFYSWSLQEMAKLIVQGCSSFTCNMLTCYQNICLSFSSFYLWKWRFSFYGFTLNKSNLMIPLENWFCFLKSNALLQENNTETI